MQTKAFWVAVVAIAIGGMIWTLGGFSDVLVGSDPGADLTSPDKINETSGDGPITGTFSGDARADDGNLVGLIISGASTLTDMAVLVITLPYDLMSLGLPPYAARPLGTLATLMVSIGLIQMIIGRRWS